MSSGSEVQGHQARQYRGRTSYSSELHYTSHFAELHAILKSYKLSTIQKVESVIICKPCFVWVSSIRDQRPRQHSAILYNFGKGLEMPRWEGAGPGWVDTREERRGVARELQKMYNSPNLDRPTWTFISAKYDNV